MPLTPHDYMAKKWENNSSHTKKKNWDALTREGAIISRQAETKHILHGGQFSCYFLKKKSQLKTLSNIRKNIINMFQIRNSIKQVD